MHRGQARRLVNKRKTLRYGPIRLTARSRIEQPRALLHLANTQRFAKQSVVILGLDDFDFPQYLEFHKRRWIFTR
jgi:hypothetical protein